jgi:hypothetical protein
MGKKDLEKHLKEARGIITSAMSLWGFMASDMSLSKDEQIAALKAEDRARKFLFHTDGVL